jgi:LPXTG-motif cell wall-anchored protein
VGTTATVIPAGPITWASGFGPNGVVASVQTAPTTATTTGTTAGTTGNNTAVAGVQTAPQTGTAVAGVSSLPSTNTGDTNGLLGLGAALMALGAFLVRQPTKSRK